MLFLFENLYFLADRSEKLILSRAVFFGGILAYSAPGPYRAAARRKRSKYAVFCF